MTPPLCCIRKTQSIIDTTIQHHNIGMIVASASYVRYFENILKHFWKTLNIPVVIIDDASLLPPWIVSDHVEYKGLHASKKKLEYSDNAESRKT